MGLILYSNLHFWNRASATKSHLHFVIASVSVAINRVEHSKTVDCHAFLRTLAMTNG
ncbi:MAG: hypothetical protein K2N54_00365 [Helicobacter sp.]|nr:hypothetical protein [Helicobacter sp.]